MGTKKNTGQEAEGTIVLGFDLEAHRQACWEAAEKEPDEHKAFHLRSAMGMPSWLCATCNPPVGAAT